MDIRDRHPQHRRDLERVVAFGLKLHDTRVHSRALLADERPGVALGAEFGGCLERAGAGHGWQAPTQCPAALRCLAIFPAAKNRPHKAATQISAAIIWRVRVISEAPGGASSG